MNDLGYVQVKRASLCVHVKKPCLCLQVNGFSFFVEGKKSRLYASEMNPCHRCLQMGKSAAAIYGQIIDC